MLQTPQLLFVVRHLLHLCKEKQLFPSWKFNKSKEVWPTLFPMRQNWNMTVTWSHTHLHNHPHPHPRSEKLISFRQNGWGLLWKQGRCLRVSGLLWCDACSGCKGLVWVHWPAPSLLWLQVGAGAARPASLSDTLDSGPVSACDVMWMLLPAWQRAERLRRSVRDRPENRGWRTDEHVDSACLN